MQSSQRLLESPFKPGTGTAEERLQELKQKSAEWIGAPRSYIDENVTFKLMDYPCDIKLYPATEAYFIDRNEAQSLPCHPQCAIAPDTRLHWQEAWATNLYPVDEVFRAKIQAWLAFNEFKHYYFDMMRKRQAEFYQLCKFAGPKQAILAKGTIAEIIRHYKIDPRQLPPHFFSSLPERCLMTLPITLDGKYTIDFQELLDFQAPIFSKEMLDTINQQYADYTQKTLLARANDLKKQELLIAEAKAALDAAPEDISAGELEILQCNLRSAHRTHITPEPVSLNVFIDTHIVEVNVPELYNPCTGKVVRDFCVNETLLTEIMQTISSFILPAQLSEVQKLVRKYSISGDAASHMTRLEAEKYPREKIPNSILQGSIPGKDTLEVMTQPVIIDGFFMIDFSRLQQYWNSNEGWLGFVWGGSRKNKNPFTGQPITSILYLDALKIKTDKFISRCDFFRHMPPEALHHPNFLEEFEAGNHYVFFNRNNPMSPPRRDTKSLLQNILSCVQYKQ